jgi:uncharacterized protein (TIGR02722 family)
MKAVKLYLIVVLCALGAGCASNDVVNVDTRNDEGKAVMALDYRDFDQAASKIVQSMLGSGALKKPEGGRYVIATGRITNDTTLRIDTDQLMVKVETEILNSGQGVMTSAVGPGADEMLQESRKLRDSEEFDPNTTAARRTLSAPELTISGKIFQSNVAYGRNKQQVEYYFQLKLSDVKSGLRFWQDEVPVVKRGSKRSVSW